jgi:tetratricopeptide (TPR) repeat protein
MKRYPSTCEKMKKSGLWLALPLLLLACSEEPKVTTRSAEALRLYEDGVRLWDQFYFSEAKAKFDTALTLDSTFAMSRARLGLLNFSMNDEQAARENIAAAMRFAAKTSRLEQLYIRLWDHEIRFDGAAAARVADSIIVLYPDEAEALVTRGILLERDQNLDSAIALYRRALTVDTSYAKAAMMLGYAYSGKGEQEKALDFMHRYIRLAPHVADPRASYADLLLRAGRYDEALDQYRESLKLKPDYWYSLGQIGNTYSLLGRLNEAQKYYEQGLSFLPQGPQVEASRATVHANLNMKRGNIAVAATGFARALKIDSTSFEASFGLAEAQAKLRKFKDAWNVVEEIKTEIERRGMSQSFVMQEFHVMRARVFLEENNLEAAKRACTEALEFSTPLSRSSVYRTVAEIHLKAGDLENAFAACEGALLLNRSHPLALLILMKVYHAARDTGMTREIGMRLLTLWKDADSDFKDRLEVQRLLGIPPAS